VVTFSLPGSRGIGVSEDDVVSRSLREKNCLHPFIMCSTLGGSWGCHGRRGLLSETLHQGVLFDSCQPWGGLGKHFNVSGQLGKQ